MLTYKMVIMTANGSICYLSHIFGKYMDEWVQEAHKYNCEKNGWKYMLLIPGTFGYDNLVLSLYHVFSNNNHDKKTIHKKSLEELSSLVHEGWKINYIYWRDHTPFVNNPQYKPPFKPLGDNQRNLCATLSYEELPEEEKEKDRIIARFILENVN